MDTAFYERRLREELAALAAASEDGKDARSPVILDQQSVGRLSRMDALQQQAMAVATEERRRIRMLALRAALERVAAGAFGDCVRCGEKISVKRLDLDPTIATCIACARATVE